MWGRILSLIPFDDRLTLLRLLSVCKAMFGHLEQQLWQFLWHLSMALPLHKPYMHVVHDGHGLFMRMGMDSQEHKNGRLYLPRLVQHIASDTQYFTRETLSFLLAAVLHEPMRNHTVDYERYDNVRGHRPLRELYRFQPVDQCLMSLDRDPDVKVYALPDGVQLPPPNEVERIALKYYVGSDKRYAVFYAIARDKLVLRDPLPDDPLYRVVLRGEHIFSDSRAIELAALFCYRAKQGAELVRMMDIVKMNVELAQLHARNGVRAQFRDDSDEEHYDRHGHHNVHHEVYQDNGELFNRLFDAAPDVEEMEEEKPVARRPHRIKQIVLDSDDDEEEGEEDEDSDTTLDSDMFSDETVDPFTDDTVSCDVPSASTPGEDVDDEESVSVTLDSGDDPADDDEDDEEDDNYALDSDTDDDIASTSTSSSSSSEDELSAELVPLQKIVDLT